MTWELHQGNARRISASFDPASVDLIVTSPPYFGLRSYTDDGTHVEGQIGAEATPAEFLDALIECTTDWMTMLKPEGNLFVNLGDKYAGSGGFSPDSPSNVARREQGGGKDGNFVLAPSQHARQPPRFHGGVNDAERQPPKTGPLDDMRQGARDGHRRSRPSRIEGIPNKSLIGIPWRYALRCIDELGLRLRAEIIWDKPNGLPESVTDRVRRSHEHWFHFTMQARSFADMDDLREPTEQRANLMSWEDRKARGDEIRQGEQTATFADGMAANPLGKVPGSVWRVTTEPLTVPAHLDVEHFAAFPAEWPRRLITGWCPPDGRVLDPFCGTGTTVAVAHLLGRHGIGVDLSRDYLRLAEWRCTKDLNLRDKIIDRSGLPKPPAIEGQESLF